jgi:hypothetical protein
VRRLGHWLAALGALALAAPATAQDAAPPAVTVIDLRPPEEKDGVALTELEGKCNREVFRIADVASDPLKVDVLKEDLAQMLSESGGKTLTVLNWSIYYNKQVQKSGGALSGIGVQGYSLPGKKKERKAGSICPRKESAGGWYEAGELESAYFPLVSEFTGTYGGKPVNVRVVHSPRRKIAGEFQGGADDTQELLDAVHATAVAVAEAALK